MCLVISLVHVKSCTRIHFTNFFSFVQPIFSFQPLCDGSGGIVNNISKNSGLIDNWRVPLLICDVGGEGARCSVTL